MKSQTQEELALKELEVVKETIQTKKKKRIETSQKIITNANEEIGFRNREIKTFVNEQLNMYEELKGLKEVLHQREEELSNLVNSHGEWSWKSSQGLEDFGGKGVDIMEGVTSGTKQSRVTYLVNR